MQKTTVETTMCEAKTVSTMKTKTMGAMKTKTVETSVSQWETVSDDTNWSGMDQWCGVSNGSVCDGLDWDQGSVGVVVGKSCWGQDGRHSRSHGKKSSESLIK